MISVANSRKIKVLSFLSAFWVVQIHSCYGVGNSTFIDKAYCILALEGLYGFAVPFFFIVSGFFFMNRYDASWRWWLNGVQKRVVSLLFPYVFWVALFIVSTRFVFGRFDVNPLTDFGLTTVTPANGAMWYVKVLFFMCLLVPVFIPLLMFLKRHHTLTPFAFMIGAIMLGVPFPGVKTYWRAMFYFTVGIGIALGVFDFIIRQLYRFLEYRYVVIVAWIIVLCIRLFHFQLGYKCESFWLYVPLLAVPSIWIMYDWVRERCSWLKNAENSPLFMSVCELSFFVYCSHEIILRLMNHVPLIKCIDKSMVVGAVLSGCFAFIMCCILGMFLKRFLTKVYAFITGGRG